MAINKTKQYISDTYNRFDVEFVGGRGATLVDANGESYLDLGSGIGINILGINHPEWIHAITRQLHKIGHISNLYYAETPAHLAEKLVNRTIFEKVFFANSGAEANECAIKVARKYSFDKYKQEARYEIISLVN